MGEMGEMGEMACSDHGNIPDVGPKAPSRGVAGE
ncbi:hypothetical protein BH23GEM9_BH23GEM9_26180 [soil metagenome]